MCTQTLADQQNVIQNPDNFIFFSTFVESLTMTMISRRQVWHLLPFLVFTLVATDSSSSAFSSPSQASTRVDQRQQIVQAPNRVNGQSHDKYNGNGAIQASLTGSLSNSGGEPEPIVGKVKNFAQKNLLIVGMACAVLFARAYPEVRQQSVRASIAVAISSSPFPTS